jgi:hypothetical protein
MLIKEDYAMLVTHQSNDTPMEEILKGIASGATQLPDFQRGWVWEDSRICALIASISNAYPVGALMFMEYGGNSTRFKYRPFEGASVSKTPDTLVLDGQQRLTSVFCSMFCRDAVKTIDDKNKEIKRYYYLDINKCLDKYVDRIDAILSLPEDKQIKEDFGRKIVFDVDTRAKEYANHVFPLNLVYDWQAVSGWRTEYQEYHNYAPEIMKLWNRFEQEVLMPIFQYKVPVIKLSKETPKEAVCQVFENVNKGGVALTVFELVTATFATDDFDLRKDWERQRDTIGEKVKWLTRVTNNSAVVDNNAYLTAMTLFTRYKAFYNNGLENGPAVSCKRVDVLNLSLQDYESNSKPLTQAFIQAGKFLEEQRIFRERDLPYATQLIPMSVIFAVLNNRADDGTVRSKIAQWYWCGVFGEMYGSANETRFANDVTGVLKWLNGDVLPATVLRANFHPTRLLSLQTRNSAAYKGVMALVLKAKALDFISGKEMDFTVFSDENIDIHHVFPKSYCEGKKYPWQKWNSVVNKTPLSYRSNRIIQGDAPSIYLGRIVKQGNVAESDLNKALSSHLIDIDTIRADDFGVYFIKRAKSLLELIGDAMGKPVTGLGSEDVVKDFGGSLE